MGIRPLPRGVGHGYRPLPYRRPRGWVQPTKEFGFNVPTSFHDSARPSRDDVLNPLQGYLGPTVPGARPYITTGSRADFLAAFNKRANFHSDARVDVLVMSAARRMIKKLVPKRMQEISWDPELYNSWLENFDSEKRCRISKAYLDAGLDRLFDYSSKELFTKIEALVKNHNTVAGRLIFKGTDLYNMLSGPMFMELMRRFLLTENNLDTVKFKVAYKQQTPEIVSHLSSIRAASFIEADFSANDKSQVRDVQNLEIEFMRRLGCPAWFLRLHRRSNKFAVYSTKYGLMSHISYQLPSGCTDGTFRNTFWNLCIFNGWCEARGLTSTRACFLGDDMLAALPRRPRCAARTYTTYAARACMEAKVTSFRSLRQGHFLSKHFYPVPGVEEGHVMLPFLGKVLAKFNSRPNANDAVSDDLYMAGKALSHAYEFRYCHLLANCFIERANVHLAVTDGAYSLEGVSYHVRMLSQYRHGITDLLTSLSWPDLVGRDDLDDFWQRNWDLTFGEVFPSFRHIVTMDYSAGLLGGLSEFIGDM